METLMPMRSLKIVAVAAIATLAGFASLTSARAMPIAVPLATATVQHAFSGEAAAPRSGLIENVHWRRGWHRHGWHGRRWHHHWH
jgi:hypothetical protein